MKAVKRGVLVLVLAAALLAAWNARTVVGLAQPALVRLVPQAAAQSVGDGSVISFPRLGIEAPVWQTPGRSPLSLADWGPIEQDLKRGVNLSYDGASFKDASFAYLTGHSSDTYPHKYSGIFAALGQAHAGDTFSLTVDGQAHAYQVVATQVLDPTNTQAFAALSGSAGGAKRLALVTCWPVLTSAKRLVVTAVEVSTGALVP